MVDTFKNKILKFLFRKHYVELEAERTRVKEVEKYLEQRANQRAAEIISKMDPYEPLLKEYHGVFSEENEKVEERLNDQGKLGMAMWAYGQRGDPHLARMIEWIMNNAGNEVLKRAPISADRTQYGRAQIANMILFRREIGRLALLYEEMLKKHGQSDDFDENRTIE